MDGIERANANENPNLMIKVEGKIPLKSKNPKADKKEKNMN